jgi:hypothetical protein
MNAFNLSVAVGAGACVLFAGCVEPKGAGATRPPEVAPSGEFVAEHASGLAAFAPATINVHRLTRLVREKEGATTIQAHVELLDRWGDSVKWPGKLVFELYQDTSGGTGVAGGPEQINVWALDLTDAEANAKAYDRVTRTYRATLTDVGLAQRSRQRLTLRVGFNPPDGRQITATYRLGE